MIEQLASVSLSCSVVILLLLFLRPLLCRRYRAKLRYWIWLALAVRLLVPLSPSWPASPVALPSLPETAVSFSVPLSGGETAVPAGGEVLTPAVPSLSVSGLLTAVWAAGAVVFLVWHLLAAFFFRRKAVRWSTVFQNGRPDVLMCKCTPSPKSCSPLSFLFLCVFFLRVFALQIRRYSSAFPRAVMVTPDPSVEARMVPCRSVRNTSAPAASSFSSVTASGWP